MTEEPKNTFGKFTAAIAVPAILTGGGLTAFAYQQGRAAGWTEHFGVQYGVADTRQSVLPFATLVLVAAALVWLLIASVRTAYALTAPSAIFVLAPAALVVPPYGLRVLGTRLIFIGLLWGFAFGATTLWRMFAGYLRRADDDGRLSRIERIMEPISSRYGRVPMPTRTLTVVVISAGFLRGAYWLGAVDGRFQARSKEDFDVLRRDATTATVIFTRTGDIVERVLDVSPGPDGKPLNVWKPGVTIRPMPDAGITFRTERLGETRPAEET